MLNRDVEIKIEKSMSKMLEQQVREIGHDLQVERGKRERLAMEVNFLKQVLYEKDKVNFLMVVSNCLKEIQTLSFQN